MRGRVFDGDSVDSIHVSDVDHGLELMIDQGDRDATIVLPVRKVRELRLILARYEREHASE